MVWQEKTCGATLQKQVCWELYPERENLLISWKFHSYKGAIRELLEDGWYTCKLDKRFDSKPSIDNCVYIWKVGFVVHTIFSVRDMNLLNAV